MRANHSGSRRSVSFQLAVSLWVLISSPIAIVEVRASGDDAADDRPAGFALGAGPLVATASSPLRSFDGARGVGLVLTLDSHVTKDLVWDLRLGGFDCDLRAPEAINYPDDDGDWSVVSTSLRLRVARTGNATWWFGPEGSLHFAQMEHFDYVGSGFGLGPALVIDLPAEVERLVARVGAHVAWVWLGTDFDEAEGPSVVATFGFDLLWEFGRDAAVTEGLERHPRR